MSITRPTKTVVKFGLSEQATFRLPYTLRREAQHMGGVLPRGFPQSDNVVRLPGGAWALNPLQGETIRLTYSDYTDAFITTGHVTLAPGYTQRNTYKRNTDPGAGVTASTVLEGAPAFVRERASGITWDNELLADVAALPKPTATPSDQERALNRILSGTVSYPANTGFGLQFEHPVAWNGAGAFLRFYWGGNAATTPTGTLGGAFSLALYGSGMADLEEWSSTGWEKRDRIQWADLGRPGPQLSHLYIIPYGKNHHAFLFREAGLTLRTLGLGKVAEWTQPGSGVNDSWIDTFGQTGHEHLDFATGQGFIHMDLNPTSRTPYILHRVKYGTNNAAPFLATATGTLVDAPFTIKTNPTANTAITVTPHTYLLPGTSVSVQLYDAATHAPLLAGVTPNTFASVAGQATYYAKFTFSTTDRFATPILWGYTVDVPYLHQTITQVPVTSEWVTSVSVSGADIDPSLETAMVSIRDLPNALQSTLRTRDEIRSAVDLVDPSSGELISRLFEGRTREVEGQLRGKPDDAWPDEKWRDFNTCRMTALWEDLAELRYLGLKDYRQDPNAPTDPRNGQQASLPWKVTDVIHQLFIHGGASASELDIPDLDMRLWPSPILSVNELVMQPGVDFARLIVKLARMFLGAVVVRDHNAGAGGMWRLITLPRYPYLVGPPHYVAAFRLEDPGGLSGKVPTDYRAWDEGETWVLDRHFQAWKRAPEVNHITVYGVQSYSGGMITTNSLGLLSAIWVNQNSISNPGHVDYVNRVKPYIRPPDPFLSTKEACNWVAAMIGANAGHAQAWFRFKAPLILIEDESDSLQTRPRPLRIGDRVTVEGLDALIRSCSPAYQHDELQWAWYEGIFLTTAVL